MAPVLQARLASVSKIKFRYNITIPPSPHKHRVGNYPLKLSN